MSLHRSLSLTIFSCLLSSALSSCHNRVYQSLANLIRWADQVMLDGIDLEDKENVASVTSVIKAVLDGVKVGPFVIATMWMVFTAHFPVGTKAGRHVIVPTGTGEADHREAGAAITDHPQQTSTSCCNNSREVRTQRALKKHPLRVVHSLILLSW